MIYGLPAESSRCRPLSPSARSTKRAAAALRQFFERATLEIEPVRVAVVRSAADDRADRRSGRADASRWFGTGYTLRVPGRWPFTAARGAARARHRRGAVGARYRAILNPQLDGRARRAVPRADRGSLRRRVLRRAAVRARGARGARSIASRRVIEMLRVAALSSYENRPISTGVLLLGGDQDPCRPELAPRERRRAAYTGVADLDQELLPARRRRAHGVPRGRRRPAARHHRHRPLERQLLSGCRSCEVPGAQAYQAHARATLRAAARVRRAQPVARDQGLRGGRRGVRVPRRRLAPARPEGEVRAVGARRSATRRWRCGCFRPRSTWPTRAKARSSSSCATRPRPCRSWSPPADRLDVGDRAGAPGSTCRRAATCCTCSRDARVTDLDPSVLVDAGVARRRDRRRSRRAAAGRRRHPAASAVGGTRSRAASSKARGRRRRWPRAGSVRC